MGQVIAKITDTATGECQIVAFTEKLWKLIVWESVEIQDGEFWNAGQIIEKVSTQ